MFLILCCNCGRMVVVRFVSCWFGFILLIGFCVLVWWILNLMVFFLVFWVCSVGLLCCVVMVCGFMIMNFLLVVSC